jgi:predicted PurR-regulated permease PerM
VYRSVGGYVVGNLLISLIAGLSTYVVLAVLGVPFAVPLAVLMAFLDLIPLVGATIAGFLIGVIAAIHSFPGDVIVWTVYLIVYQQVENNFIQPQVYRRTVQLHPLVVIVAVLIGASLLGVLGALVAIPVAGALQILARDWWQLRQARGPLGTETVAVEVPEGA